MTAKRVLVIDDDPTLRRLIGFGLTRAGYATRTAENGEAAKALLQAEPADLVLVDLMMPVVDGLRFLRWLRDEVRLTVPALVFTSYDAPGLAAEAAAIGATDLIHKPVRLPELLDRVAALLSGNAGREGVG